MNVSLVNMGRGAGVVLGLALAATSYGQSPMPAPLVPKPASIELLPKPLYSEQGPKPVAGPITAGVHRMEIMNGTTGISVRYFGKGLAPTEMAALRDLERAENEAAFGETLASLRNQYLRNEMEMETVRHLFAMANYGVTTSRTFGGSVGGGCGYGYMNGLSNNYALVNNPLYGAGGLFPGQVANSPVYPSVYTPGYWGDNFGGTVTTMTGLQFGMGDEGVVKNDIVKAMAAHNTPESIAATYHSLDNAASRVAALPRVREGLGQTDPSNIGLAGYGPITLTLKDKTEVKGNLVREDADWLYLTTDTEDVTVRKADVMKTVRPKK